MWTVSRTIRNDCNIITKKLQNWFAFELELGPTSYGRSWGSDQVETKGFHTSRVHVVYEIDPVVCELIGKVVLYGVRYRSENQRKLRSMKNCGNDRCYRYHVLLWWSLSLTSERGVISWNELSESISEKLLTQRSTLVEEETPRPMEILVRVPRFCSVIERISGRKRSSISSRIARE